MWTLILVLIILLGVAGIMARAAFEKRQILSNLVHEYEIIEET
jgi:hypothetical protein